MMIVVLYENPSNVILPFMTKLKERYPNSSRGYVSHRDKLADLLALYSKPPLFTAGWLLECSPSVRANTLRALDIDKNVLVIRVTTAKQRESVLEKLDGLPIKFIDNYRLKKEEVVDWISNELGTGRELSQLVYKKTGGNLNAIVESVSTLSLLPVIGEKEIEKYARKVSNYGVMDIVYYLVGDKSCKAGYKDVVKVIKEYRWATKWLYKFLTNSLVAWVRVLTLATIGDISLVNYESYKDTCDDKEIKKLTSYQLKRILENFGTVSVEKLIFLECQVASLDYKNKTSIFKLIQLLRLRQ